MASSSPSGPFGLVVERLPRSVKKVGKDLTEFWMNVETATVVTFSSSAVFKNVGNSIQSVSQAVVRLRRNVDNRVATVQSSVARSISDLRSNVQRNVQILTYKCEGEIDHLQPSDASLMTLFSSPRSTRNSVAEVAVRPRDQSLPSISSDSLSSNMGNSDGVDEDIHHPNLSSVSSTTVFSIGYVGVPLLGPVESVRRGFSQQNTIPEEGASVAKLGSLEMAKGSLNSSPDAPLWVVDARRMIGSAVILYQRIRSLGLPQNSWENKMPWRNPPPAYLAKGLRRPRKHFSSERERQEYHAKARKRKRFLYPSLPGWSWFAADVLFLALLINNPGAQTFIM